MAILSVVENDDLRGLWSRAAPHEVDAAAEFPARVVGAIPLQVHLAGGEHAIGERADFPAGDVVDVDLDTAGLRDPEAHGGDAVAHDRVADLQEIENIATADGAWDVQDEVRRRKIH